MNIGARLKRCRNALKKTQQQVSDDLEIRRSTYAKYETGENEPDLETVRRFAEYFGVNTDYLLGNEKRTEDTLPASKTESIIKELVDRYSLDLTQEGTREKLEALIRIVVDHKGN